MFSDLFTRILVPYDGSTFSKKALNQAMEIAHNLESEIFVFTVINATYISPPGMLHGLTKSRSEKNIIEKWKGALHKETEKMLAAVINRCKGRGITASYHISYGNVANEILSFAKKRRATLIVMGSQGLHGLSKIKVLGSVSRKVSELAPCPVLIVR